MNISALLTSAGINIGMCALLLCFYSILRKQPGLVNVYFGGRLLAQENIMLPDAFRFEMLLPSPSWILKAWKSTEDDILAAAGLDAVVFLRLLVFRLWAHCLALYIITFSACILLYFEYQKIAELRLAHFTGSPANPSHFTVLVRSIPRSTEESFSDAVKNFFMNYHASSYLAHQMIYRTGKVQRLMNNAEKIYKKIVYATPSCLYQECRPMRVRCGLCGGTSSSFNLYSNELQLAERHPGLDRLDSLKEKECAAAFVFFKTRYAAVVASQVLQSSNPMLWVTDLAPEPHDVYWSNLWLPYGQLWLRRITNLLASIVFMFLFLLPVTFVQGLSQLDKLQRMFPFLKSILNKGQFF
ncbi:CSC1-like protein RXW8 isoform X6 [Magnolia sinica]|uniref:CSC1-like protein RXW8 isoform X6 n=1 Tax=Magnolia sinica TaxID=86752 RepID=UPI002658BA00|nr:CSC1-like protein RXW8 isoform X6 [Magnolia sinica]